MIIVSTLTATAMIVAPAEGSFVMMSMAEPLSLVLFGTALSGVAAVIRRRIRRDRG